MASNGNKLIHGIDSARVEEAVRQAERRSSGEIRVVVARFYFWGDVWTAAATAFEKLGMTRTRRRNGVLIFVAPWRRRFAVLGDIAVQAKTPTTFWAGVVNIIAAGFRRGDPTAGLEQGIAAIGDELATWFPPEPGDINELPDTVARPGRDPKRPI